ncbi:MAG: RNA-directed DNA polymerase [Candidatus Saccharicenans sp.]|uniref:RNA-directed DNA polymerase n=1 Tax=Candidatus Saccharicenans sp. TaxID=2819258 RepID=UPI004049CFF2
MNSKQKNISAPKYKSLLEMRNDEACSFFLKEQNYCSIELPNYFTFKSLLNKINKSLNDNISYREIRKYDDVSYKIYSNKDGKYLWRPFEIIHPVVYIDLVNKITSENHWKTILNRFQEFQKNEKIKCLSIPVKSTTKSKNNSAQILKWWLEIEQKSIELSLKFDYMFHADIADCYASIYTHSIAWAIHGKEEAKEKKNDKILIGNIIDIYIQNIHNGHTNGIPQGSVLMDFIAEMVLGYSDLELTNRLIQFNIKEYQILRYRDDYRIFVKNTNDGELILKTLTVVLLDLGLKLNSTKTTNAKNIISNSLKDKKYEWIFKKQEDKDIQKSLLIIHAHGLKFPNAGSLVTALNKIDERLENNKNTKIKNPLTIISIVADIAYNNPRTIPACVSIISKMIQNFEKDEQIEIIKSVHEKFLKSPNMGLTEIWLQRISFRLKQDIDYNEKLCKVVA